jgi:hypothetical protein
VIQNSDPATLPRDTARLTRAKALAGAIANATRGTSQTDDLSLAPLCPSGEIRESRPTAATLSQAGSRSSPNSPVAGSRCPTMKSISASPARALLSAETEHESVRALAASLLAMGSKQKSAALGPGFRSVARAATSPALPLHLADGPEQK